MAMKKYKVEDLKPGMVFDKAVYIDMNNILVAPMVPLKEEDINRLIKWGIEEIETAGEVVKQGSDEQSHKVSISDEVKRLTKMAKLGNGAESVPVVRNLQTAYADAYSLVEDVFKKVRNGAGYDKEKILNGVDDILTEASKDTNAALNEVTMEHDGKYIYTLGVNVSILSMITGLSLGFGKDRLIPLGAGALLHDIGMVRVPNYIAEKKGSLTHDEYNRIKTHTVYGYRIVLNELDLGNDIANIVMQHHEMYDGSGYPRKLKGEDISDYARIASICDVFIAMIKKRSYRDAHMSYSAMKNILSGTNRKYDPDYVKAFLSNMAIYPVGSIVQLNNGVMAKVVSANSELPLRPKVSVMVDEFGEKPYSEKIIDLEEVNSIFIKKPVSKSQLKKFLNEE
jgi:HD-GYP domain-containing protein (c-di-GMP phosphodiesterase class II)